MPHTIAISRSRTCLSYRSVSLGRTSPAPATIPCSISPCAMISDLDQERHPTFTLRLTDLFDQQYVTVTALGTAEADATGADLHRLEA